VSRYGSVAAGATITTRTVQSARPDDLGTRVNQALDEIAALPNMQVIASMTLAGAGDGHTFTVTIEAAAMADVEGGLTPGATGVLCYMASQAEALTAAREALTLPADPLADVQVAGSSGGTRFMGLLAFGVIQGGSGGGCLTPLFRVLYVDGQTTTPQPDRNGSISCPYKEIQEALDTIPAPPDFEDVEDLIRPFELLVAPGVYPEDVVIPTSGYSIVLKGIGAPGPAEPFDPFVFFAPAGSGTSVVISDLAGGVGRIALALTGPFWDQTEPVLIPSYQFESIFAEQFEFDAEDMGEPALLEALRTIFRRCAFFDMEDLGQSQKWESIVYLHETSVGVMEMDSVLLLGERSFVGEAVVGVPVVSDSAFGSLGITDPDGASALVSASLKDTEVLGLLGGVGDPITLDAVTAYSAVVQGALDKGEERRVAEDDSRAMQAATTLVSAGGGIVSFNPGENSLSVIATGGSPRQVDLPSAAVRAVDTPIAGLDLGELVFIHNDPSSTETLSVVASGTDTLDSGPISVPIGGSLILLAITTARWIAVGSFP
jgi:hypothetical protein